MKPNWKNGLYWTAYMAVAQFIIVAGTYLTGCALFKRYECNVSTGWTWFLHHPVFPSQAVFWIVATFLVSTFVRITIPDTPFGNFLKSFIAWALVICLLAAFVLWGMPDFSTLRPSSQP